MENKIYDFAAVGVGPFNLGLACLTEPVKGLQGVFVDKNDEFNWHPGMLLQDTTLQIPFLADLVTMADPTSKFSFLNYLKEQGRIYSFYIRENFQILRKEYNLYCQWAVKKISNIYFNKKVQEINYDKANGCYILTTSCTQTGAEKVIRARKLILGTGTFPYVPTCVKNLTESAIHSSSYLTYKNQLQERKSITIVGSGQSAAEIYYDLLQDIDTFNYELNWITRSPRFFPLEYSKFTLEMTSPDYVDYFFALPQDKRDNLVRNQKQLYKGVNNDLLGSIFDLLYTKKLSSNIKVNLRTNCKLEKAVYIPKMDHFELKFLQEEQEKHFATQTEAVVFATGYSYKIPDFIDGISSRILWDEKGRYHVNRNYTIDKNSSEIFVQNAELHTHGFVTPDLGMGCYRNSIIINEITGKEHYKTEKRIAFQQFNVNEEEMVGEKIFNEFHLNQFS